MPGFLPFSRASFGMDLVVVGMAVLVPLLLISLLAVRKQQLYQLHRKLQLSAAGLLVVALIIFEIDIRIYGWKERAMASPFYETIMFPILYIHLGIAVSTTILWVVTITLALKRFPRNPRPNQHSVRHRLLGRLALAGMLATAITGWCFYYLAFVAGPSS